jgi:hypothetical protein
VRATEHDERVDGVAFLRVVQQLSREPSPRFDQQIKPVLVICVPRSDSERVSLEERPEADRRNLQVYILPSIHRQRLGET